MSDDLNDLKQALQATTPTPEAARKAEHLMLAEKNFERLQETTKPHRHTFRQSDDGHFKGVKKMISMLSNRMALGTATALACAGLIAVFPEISAQFGDQKRTNPVIDPHAAVQSSPEYIYQDRHNNSIRHAGVRIERGRGRQRSYYASLTPCREHEKSLVAGNSGYSSSGAQIKPQR